MSIFWFFSEAHILRKMKDEKVPDKILQHSADLSSQVIHTFGLAFFFAMDSRRENEDPICRSFAPAVYTCACLT